jgi:multiple sugar transport system substrate-binding protein
MRARRFVRAALAVVMSALAAGCGSSASGAEGVPQIGFTTGRDPTGINEQVIANCNKQANGRYRIEAIYNPPTVDAQREQLIRRLAGKDPSLDVLAIDVIWTAEFSEARWIFDLTDQIAPVKNTFVPAALQTAEWKGKYWAVPVGTNVAVLYYRTDLVKEPPTTWEEMVRMAKEVQRSNPGMAGFLWQANQYEGLTVDAMEFIYAANGKVLSDDGTKSLLADGDGAVHAFTFMRSLFADGVSPRQVLTFQEEESRQMFQQGKAVFLRNWPYVYSLASGPDSKIKGKFDVVPLPAFDGRQTAGVLGGVNYAISRFSDHPKLAWEALQCLSSPEHNKLKMIAKGELSALEATYKDPEVIAKIPFTKVARTALDSAYARPATPYYNDLTTAINRNANNVAAGRLSPEEGVRKAHRSIQLAIDGKGEI